MNTGPSIPRIVGMLFHWLQKWLTSFKYFTHFFPPSNWNSEHHVRLFHFIFYWCGIAERSCCGCNLDLHTPPPRSRFPKCVNIELRLLQWDCTQPNVLFSGHQWRMIPTTLWECKTGKYTPSVSAEQLRCDLTVTGHLACCKLCSVWHQRNKQTKRSIRKRVKKKNVCVFLCVQQGR